VKGVYVQGVTEEFVCSGDEALEAFEKGAKNRAVASTGLNAGSSRSHSVFCIEIIQKNLEDGSEKTSKMTLCDLAGSETVKKTGVKGQQMEEAKAINKSLSALGQVIKALTSTKIKHIPFRDSKLTRMLQDAIGGNSRTTLMICMSPSKYNVEESVSTCRFGARAKMIKNKAKVNQLRSVEELEKILARLESVNKAHKKNITALKALLEKNGISCEDLGIDLAELSKAQGGDGAATVQAAVTQVAAALHTEKEEAVRRVEEAEKLTMMLRQKETEVKVAEQALQEALGLIERLEAEVNPSKIAEQQSEKERLEKEGGSALSLAEIEKQIELMKQENENLKSEGTNAWSGERKQLMTEINKLKKDLEAARGMGGAQGGGGDSPDENAKQRKQMQSLQQRLEQMVLVHKSILRKHASAELKHREANKKLVLRDARIKQLEDTARAIGDTMRQQAEAHMAEMAKVREQVAKLRETSKQGGGFFKKTVRGGN